MKDSKAYRELAKYLRSLKTKPNPFWTLEWDYGARRCTRVFTTLGAVVGLSLAVALGVLARVL